MKKMIMTLGLVAACSFTTVGCAGKQQVDNSALEACQASEAQARADLEAAQQKLAALELEGAELRALLDERAKLEAELRKALAEMIDAGELTIARASASAQADPDALGRPSGTVGPLFDEAIYRINTEEDDAAVVLDLMDALREVGAGPVASSQGIFFEVQDDGTLAPVEDDGYVALEPEA